MIRWDYDMHEILADGVVHALGVVGGLVAVIALLILAAPTVGAWELTSVANYGVGLLAVLVISAVYNLWPVSPVKWILRRFDPRPAGPGRHPLHGGRGLSPMGGTALPQSDLARLRACRRRLSLRAVLDCMVMARG
ncbi:hypothetical protein ILT44_21810 [Microvirga sp. BT689]|uniref:hypothetical protein n=1 Tax=Microvirga arvi TaxID=2778731 RepID=UPI0019517F1D|nr:hypothetical protein [Microvirga arvi]MBM6582846.1 hypothetical protein [Microvirga arvi]